MKQYTHLLFGVGEVGSALKKILQPKTRLFWYDINPKIDSHLPDATEKIDVLHITYPYSKTFTSTTKKLIKQYNPKLIVIHSTTEVGVTQKLGRNAIHSPILGQHDNLYMHVKKFRKAVGANSPTARKASQHYLGNIFDLEFYKNSRTTEVAKILSLTKFAISVEFARYSNDFCKKSRTDFSESYTKFSELYNEGYEKVNIKKFVHPVLTPPKGKIGGSCVIPGVEKALKVLKDSSLDEIIKQNKSR